jgi:predicted AlkP superfamily pyrophosphatase or phosphodiesterase
MFCLWAVAIAFCLPPAVCVGETPEIAARNPASQNTVLWISVDGFRGDYVDRGKSPFLRTLMEHGLYSRQLVPVFPSLTFPSHVSEVTGVLPGVHGIVSNKYFDTITGQEFNLSVCPQALRAEPIWFTATRQGVRTAVIDWPLSEGQDQLPAGTLRTACFNPDFDTDLTDRERLGQLVEKYRADFDRPLVNGALPGGPLRLLMGYAYGVDKAGHKQGPTSKAVDHAIGEMDQMLQQIVGEVAAQFNKHMDPKSVDALWVLLTTDHGMSDVKQMVNIRHLMGDDLPADDVPESVIAATSGGLAHLYFHRVAASQREAVKERVLARLRKVSFGKVWTREELPAEWGYDAPGRTGDLVFSMDQGYAFSGRDDVTIAPVDSDTEFPRGMHSYDPAVNKEMLGFCVLARIGSTAPGRDVGPLDSLRIHPTVAKLLGIEPAAGATGQPLDTSGM